MYVIKSEVHLFENIDLFLTYKGRKVLFKLNFVFIINTRMIRAIDQRELFSYQ